MKTSFTEREEVQRLLRRLVVWADAAPQPVASVTIAVSKVSEGVLSALQVQQERLAEMLGAKVSAENRAVGSQMQRLIDTVPSLTPRYLCARMDVPESSIYRYLRGQGKPGYNTLLKLQAVAREEGVGGSILEGSLALPMSIVPIGTAQDRTIAVTVTKLGLELLQTALTPPLPDK